MGSVPFFGVRMSDLLRPRVPYLAGNFYLLTFVDIAQRVERAGYLQIYTLE